MSAPHTTELRPSPGRLRGQAAVRLHLALAAGLALSTTAFGFEIDRALSGHELSWVYVFEWPLLAAFGVHLWWSLLHGRDRHPRSTRRRSDPGAVALDSGTDDQLAAWQHYLAELERPPLGDERGR